LLFERADKLLQELLKNNHSTTCIKGKDSPAGQKWISPISLHLTHINFVMYKKSFCFLSRLIQKKIWGIDKRGDEK